MVLGITPNTKFVYSLRPVDSGLSYNLQTKTVPGMKLNPLRHLFILKFICLIGRVSLVIITMIDSLHVNLSTVHLVRQRLF